MITICSDLPLFGGEYGFYAGDDWGWDLRSLVHGLDSHDRVRVELEGDLDLRYNPSARAGARGGRTPQGGG